MSPADDVSVDHMRYLLSTGWVAGTCVFSYANILYFGNYLFTLFLAHRVVKDSSYDYILQKIFIDIGRLI